MKSLFLALLFLPTLLFGASIPFSGLQPDQFGSNVGTGKMWVKDGYLTTNAVITSATIYGSAARTNALFLGPSGVTVSNAVGTTLITLPNGNVAIGTNGSSENLTVFNATGTATMSLRSGNGNSRFDIFNGDSNKFSWQVPGSGATQLNLQYNGATKSRTLSTGAMLFGLNSSPVNMLDIAGSAVIGSSYAGVNTAPTDGLLVLGNVGIGTTTPGTMLHIAQTLTAANGNFQTNVTVTNLTTTGSLKVGPGTTITNIVSATAALDFGSILAAASADLTITVAGAKANDGVFLGLPVDPDASLVFNAFVSAANTVTVRAFNVGAIAVDQASKTFRVVVNQF